MEKIPDNPPIPGYMKKNLENAGGSMYWRLRALKDAANFAAPGVLKTKYNINTVQNQPKLSYNWSRDAA